MICLKDHTHNAIRVVNDDDASTLLVLAPSQARALAYELLNALYAPSPVEIIAQQEGDGDDKNVLYAQVDIDNTKKDLEELADAVESGAEYEDDAQVAILDRLIAYVGAMTPTAPVVSDNDPDVVTGTVRS